MCFALISMPIGQPYIPPANSQPASQPANQQPAKQPAKQPASRPAIQSTNQQLASQSGLASQPASRTASQLLGQAASTPRTNKLTSKSASQPPTPNSIDNTRKTNYVETWPLPLQHILTTRPYSGIYSNSHKNHNILHWTSRLSTLPIIIIEKYDCKFTVSYAQLDKRRAYSNNVLVNY